MSRFTGLPEATCIPATLPGQRKLPYLQETPPPPYVLRGVEGRYIWKAIMWAPLTQALTPARHLDGAQCCALHIWCSSSYSRDWVPSPLFSPPCAGFTIIFGGHLTLALPRFPGATLDLRPVCQPWYMLGPIHKTASVRIVCSGLPW